MADGDHGSGDRSVNKRKAKGDDHVGGRDAKPDEHAKLSKKHYEREIEKLQEELVKLQYWVKEKGLKVASSSRGATPPARAG